MLFGPDGAVLQDVPPGPSPALEERVNRELQALDTLLHIRWVDNIFYNQSKQRFEGRYGLACHWPQIDKRWEYVKSGKWDGACAYDILGWMTQDMQDASSLELMGADAVIAKALELLARCDNTRQPWAERMLGSAKKNAKARKQAVTRAGDIAAMAAAEIYGVKSFGYGGKGAEDMSRRDYSGLQREVEEELGRE